MIRPSISYAHALFIIENRKKQRKKTKEKGKAGEWIAGYRKAEDSPASPMAADFAKNEQFKIRKVKRRLNILSNLFHFPNY